MSPRKRSEESNPSPVVRVVDLTKHVPDPIATAALEASVARRHCVIPLCYEGERLVLVMADPADSAALDDVAARTGVPVEAAMAPRQDVIRTIDGVYGPQVGDSEATTLPDSPSAEVESAVRNEKKAPKVTVSEPVELEESPVETDKSAPVSGRLGLDERGQALDLHDLFMQVIVRGASDLHLTNGLRPTIRVDGDLMQLEGYPVLDADTLRRLVYSMLTQKQRDRFEEDLELDFSYSLPSKERFRVNVYIQRGILGAAFRLVPSEIKSVEELGVPPQAEEFSRLPRGLIVVTGPTGSGKTTTLAALIDVINRDRPVHIMTVEDPIEFVHPHKRAVVNQREVGADTHGFAQALRHVLRQDPDVILVGEMRDLETIQMAVTAAETGHLVFATLHTQDAAQTVDRMIDVFPPHQQQQIRVQLAGSLMGVVAQQLLPKRDTAGRVVACEILVVTPAVRNLVREGKTHQLYSVMQAGGQFSMQTMDAALAHLTRNGEIAYDVAKERCHNAEEFARLAGSGGGVRATSGYGN